MNDRDFLRTLGIDPDFEPHDRLPTIATKQESALDRHCRERQQALAAAFENAWERPLRPDTTFKEVSGLRSSKLGPKRTSRLVEQGIVTLADAARLRFDERCDRRRFDRTTQREIWDWVGAAGLSFCDEAKKGGGR